MLWNMWGLLRCEVFTWVTCQADGAGPLSVSTARPRYAGLQSLPFGLRPLPWYQSMLVTMTTGVESGHLVHLSNSAHAHTHSTAFASPFSESVRSGRVWWFGGHAWWSSGSLRPDYWPTNQLAHHMDGNYSPALCSVLLLLSSPPPILHSSSPPTCPSIPPHHSTPADLLVLFNESLGSPAPEWKFHPRHPPCVTLGFILCSWWRFGGTGRSMMHGNYKMRWDFNHSLAEKGLLH